MTNGKHEQPMNDSITIPFSIDTILNDFEKSFIGQCHPLQYRALTNRIVLEPFIRDDHGNKVIYSDLVVCDCASPIVMWVQDGGRKTVYRMCAKHGLVFNGHLERRKNRTEDQWEDVRRRGNSRRGWSEAR